MPSVDKFARNAKLRLEVFPGERKQFIQLWNTKTGERIATVPLGGGGAASATPFGLTVPAISGASTAQTFSDSTGGGGGGGGGSGGSASGTSGDGASGDDEDCPECDPSFSYDSYGVRPPTDDESGEGTCEPESTGDPEDTAPDAPDDDSNGGSPGSPTSPEPPNPTTPPPIPPEPEDPPPPGSAPDAYPPPQTPPLFDSAIANLEKVKGGARISISTGSETYPVVFSARHLQQVNLNSETFRRYFICQGIGKYKTTVEDTVDSDWNPIPGLRTYWRSYGARGVIADENGFRSMYTGRWLINLVQVTPGVWELQFTDWNYSSWLSGKGVFDYGGMLLNASGYFSVFHRWEFGGALISSVPTSRWRFSSALEGGRNVITVEYSSSKNAKRSLTRYWQTEESNGTRHTFKEDVINKFTTEVVDRNHEGNFVRGHIVHRGTGATATKEGWIMRTGPDPAYTSQPVYGPGDDPNVALINFGGSGNTTWKWMTNGMWEKTTVTPSTDAPVRRIQILRPGGTATSPITAAFGDSHATVEDINELPIGKVRTRGVSLNGVEIGRAIYASHAVPGPSGFGEIRMTDTLVRYPAGLQSAPSVSISQRFSNRMSHPGAGRIVFSQSEDGTRLNVTYTAGRLIVPDPSDPNTPPDAEWEFNPMDGGNLADYGAREIQRDITYTDGRAEREIIWEDEEGRVRVMKRYVLIDGDPVFTEAVRRTYRGTDLLVLERKLSPNAPWRKEYEVLGTLSEPNSVVETDESGLRTTSAYAGIPDNHPATITREAAPASGGLPAVPQQITEFVYDSAGRVTSQVIRQGTTVLEQETRTYNAAGQVESITVNGSAVTEYRYADAPNGGEMVSKYRRSISGASPGTLVSQTVTDWRGNIVSIVGPGMVEEHRTETAVGVGRIQTISARGPAGSPLTTEIIERDGLGNKIAEKVSVPNGQWRTWTYDPHGRKTAEKINNQTVRTWTFGSSGVVTETITPTPDPTRTVQYQISHVREGSVVWESRISGARESQQKVAGFGISGNEFSVRRFREYGGAWTTVTLTADTGAKAVIETTVYPGVTDASVRKYRAGEIAWEKAHSGNQPSTFSYDALDRITGVSENNGARSTTVTYDPIYGKIANITISGTDGTSSTETKTYYSPSESTPGRLKTHVTNGATTNYSWTPRGEMEATWGAAYPVKYDYDAVGRPWKMHTYRTATGGTPGNPATWSVGDVTQWTYYPGTMALQSKKDTTNKGPTYEYDPRGWLSKRIWARTVAGGPLNTVYSYNRLGELTNIDYNDATTDVSITRDNKGRISGLSDAGGGSTYLYNMQDRLEREISNGSGSALIYQYDSHGRRVGYGYWDQTGGAWATWGGWGYDPSTGRLNGVSTPEGWISQSYQAGTDRAATVTFGGISSTRGYDGLGRLKSLATTAAGIPNADPALTRTYGFNAAGRRQTLTDENNDHWQYGYNSRGEVTEASKRRGAALLQGQQLGYSYDEIGNRTGTSREGRFKSWQVNSLNQHHTVQQSNYALDVIGEANPAATVSLNFLSTTYRNNSYFHAFVPFFDNQSTTPLWYSATVREQMSGQTPVESNRKFFISPAFVFPAYDLDGNLTQDERWTYTWNAENQLIRQETRWQGASAIPGMPILRLEYKYDAYRRRIEKKVSTWSSQANAFQQTKLTRFVYDDWNLIAEWEAEPVDMGLVRTYHWSLDLSGTKTEARGVGGLVLTRHHVNPTGQTSSFFPAYDANGNVMALYDTNSGRRAAEYEYGPFGEPLRVSGPAGKANQIGYSTKYTDDETELVYYGFRYYSPKTGRWLGREPVAEEMSLQMVKTFGATHLSAQEINERIFPNDYLFLANRPLGSYDILGLLPAGTYPEWGGLPPHPPYVPRESKGNCWRYACNDPGKPGEPHKTHPADPRDTPTERRYVCEDIMAGAKKRGAEEPDPATGDCPCGYYKIMGVVQDKEGSKMPDGRDYHDYHWYRQNDDGTWSDKPGGSSVNTGIKDPVADAKKKKYDKNCGILCVPGGGLETD
jgi:RHS repeat-associated protein